MKLAGEEAEQGMIVLRAADPAANTAAQVRASADRPMLDDDCRLLLETMEPDAQAAVIGRDNGWGQ
eukprot:10577955-Alexandrium_andersonii.AAC.1